MTRRGRRLIPLLLAALAAAGCKEPGPAKQPSEPSITLKQVGGAAFGGFSLQLPDGTKVVETTKVAQTFRFDLGSGRDIEVQVTPVRIHALADLVRLATMVKQGRVADKETRAGMHLVEVAHDQETAVWASRRDGDRGITARCAGPASKADVLRAMCGALSLEPGP